jgi:hypothetical protein
MQPSSQNTPVSLQHSAEEAQPRNREDLTYQAVTVAAIVLLLSSLWVF